MKGCIGNPSWWNKMPSEYKINRCYHTTWQSHSGMRFILLSTYGENATLGTKYSNKTFKSKLNELRDTTGRR